MDAITAHAAALVTTVHQPTPEQLAAALEKLADDLWRISAAIADEEAPDTSKWLRAVIKLTNDFSAHEPLVVALLHQLDEWDQWGRAVRDQELADEMADAYREDQLLAASVAHSQGRPRCP